MLATTTTDPRMLMRRVSTLLEGFQYRFANEAQLHQALATVLTGTGIAFEHEKVLSPRDRIDFWLPTDAGAVVIEVKVQGSLAAAMSQVHRYAALDNVAGLVIAATCRWAAMPLSAPTLHDLPIALVHLQRQCL